MEKERSLEKMVEEMIERAIQKNIPKIAALIPATPAREEKQRLSMAEAVEYCRDMGLPISKSTLYKHTMAGTIPFMRAGERKIVFNVNELEEWIETRMKKVS